MKINIQLLKKLTASTLAILFLSLPIVNLASAAPRHENHPPRQEERREDRHHGESRHENRKHETKRDHRREESRQDKHHPDNHHKENKRHDHRPEPPRDHHRKSNNDKAVAGFILGAILGTVIANNS